MGRIHRAVHTPSSRAATESRSPASRPGATLEASFFVQGAAAEQVGRPARPEVLEELARVTRGKVIEADKLDEVVRRWPSCPIRRPRCAGCRSGVIR